MEQVQAVFLFVSHILPLLRGLNRNRESGLKENRYKHRESCGLLSVCNDRREEMQLEVAIWMIIWSFHN